MELYDTNTNGTKPSGVLNHIGGINETSLSGGDDELISNSNKSEDRFSGQTTDYDMVSLSKIWFAVVSASLKLIINIIFDNFKTNHFVNFDSQEIPPPASMMALDNRSLMRGTTMLSNGHLHSLQSQQQQPHYGAISTYLLDENLSAPGPYSGLPVPNSSSSHPFGLSSSVRYSSLGMHPFS